MKSIEDQLAELDAELKHLQKNFVFKVDTDTELKTFILETKAHQFAITNLVCSILAKMNDTNLHAEKQRYEVFQKSRLIDLMKKWLKKYNPTVGPTGDLT